MPHLRGTVSMARAQSENSANSQFFIVFYPRFSLDDNYTNFGRVISNMAGVDAIQRGEPPAEPHADPAGIDRHRQQAGSGHARRTDRGRRHLDRRSERAARPRVTGLIAPHPNYRAAPCASTCSISTFREN